ncbi:MAG: SbmA/BacA-like family transporter [Burkholderiaceae bacterium]
MQPVACPAARAARLRRGVANRDVPGMPSTPPHDAPTIENRSGNPDRLPRCATAFWLGDRRRFAWGLTLALVVLTIAQAAVPVALNLWSHRLFDALEQRNFTTVLRETGVAGLIILANLLVMTSHLRTRRRLQIEWRADLTRRLLDRWMVRGRDLQLQRQSVLDNPDGRITEDVRVATEASVDLAHSLFYCVLLLVSFAQILWGLSGITNVRLGSWELALPGYLVWAALIYAGLGAALATWLGQPLTRAANLRQGKEADFRFGLASSRESGATIAKPSIDSARPEADRRFIGLIGAWTGQTRALANLVMFSSSWTMLSQAVPILVVAPRYIAGTITLGVLMQTAQAFQQMTQALTWPIENMQRLAEARASLTRVTQLHRWLVETPPDGAGPNPVDSADENRPARLHLARLLRPD